MHSVKSNRRKLVKFSRKIASASGSVKVDEFLKTVFAEARKIYRDLVFRFSVPKHFSPDSRKTKLHQDVKIIRTEVKMNLSFELICGAAEKRKN